MEAPNIDLSCCEVTAIYLVTCKKLMISATLSNVVIVLNSFENVVMQPLETESLVRPKAWSILLSLWTTMARALRGLEGKPLRCNGPAANGKVSRWTLSRPWNLGFIGWLKKGRNKGCMNKKHRERKLTVEKEVCTSPIASKCLACFHVCMAGLGLHSTTFLPCGFKASVGRACKFCSHQHGVEGKKQL